MLAVVTLWSIFTYLATTAAVSIGMYYLSQALFGQDLPEAEAPEDASGRLWNPHTTRREGLPSPRSYGRNMHPGNIIAKWTDVDGNDREILYLLLEHGDGPTQGNVADQIWLNDQPADHFGSVVIQERKGTMDQTCMEGFEKLKLEYTPNTELKEVDDEHIWTTPNLFFDDIEWTICFPNGLARWKKSGSRRTTSVHFHVRIREHPDGGWTNLLDGDITAGVTTPYFKKYSASEQGFTCTRGKKYDLGFKRITADGGNRVVRNSTLRSLREVVDVAFTHPGKALTGIKAIATAQLSGNIDVKIIREDRLVNVYNGTIWEIKYSHNRAWVTYDLFTQPVISGNGDTISWKIERYEGIHPSHLDLEFFYNWASFCADQVPDGYGGTEDRLACDIKVDYQTDVWSITHDIAQVGRAYLYWKGTQLTGWIDKVVSEPTDLVTMDNIMARTWKNHWVNEDELAGVVNVFYQDKRQGYERVPATYPKAAAGSYKRTKSIEGIGIKTYGTAIHVANHALTRNELIRNINAFRQFKDGFRHKLGEVIRLQQRTPDWGQGYRVIKCPSSSTMKLDREVIGVDADDLLYVRSYDDVGEVVDNSVYTVVSTSGAIVTIAEVWDPTPVKNNIVAIGVGGAIVLRRIIKMEPTVDNYFDIEVETYDAALYDADDLDPDAPNKDYDWSAPAGTIAKPVSHDEVVDLIETLLPPQPDIDVPQRSNCAWSGDSVDTVTWAKDDATEDIVFRFEGVDYAITPDDTTDEFIYWDPNFSTSFKTTNLVTIATAAGNWLMCRNIDGVAYPVPCTIAANIGIILAGFLRVGTADIENLAVTTAKIDNLAVETLKIKDDAVTVPVSAFTAGSIAIIGSEVILQSVSITTSGAKVLILFTGVVAGEWTTDVMFRIYRDTTKIYENLHNDLYGYYMSHAFSVSLSETPSAGTYTYYIKAYATPEAAAMKNRSLFVIETKK